MKYLKPIFEGINEAGLVTLSHAEALAKNFRIDHYVDSKVRATGEWYKILLYDKKGKEHDITIWKDKIDPSRLDKYLKDQIKKYEPVFNIIQTRMRKQ